MSNVQHESLLSDCEIFLNNRSRSQLTEPTKGAIAMMDFSVKSAIWPVHTGNTVADVSNNAVAVKRELSELAIEEMASADVDQVFPLRISVWS